MTTVNKKIEQTSTKKVNHKRKHNNSVETVETKAVKQKKQWFCYLISSSTLKKTYVGITTDVNRRIKEHGHSIKSARYTKGNEWHLICFVSGFHNHIQACQFEKKWFVDRLLGLYCFGFCFLFFFFLVLFSIFVIVLYTQAHDV